MERMNEILARAASRRITTRRAPTPAPSATSAAKAASAAPSSPLTPSSSSPRHTAPRRILTAQTSGKSAASIPPRRLPADADADTSQPTPPAADVLENDRILELPARPATGIVRLGSARAAGVPPREMTSLRELAPTYAAQLGPRRAVPGASSANGASSAANQSSQASASNTSSRKAQSVRATRATGKASAPGVCPLCHGAGYVRLDVPVGDPAFGQAIRCQCKEQQLEERERFNLRRLSNLDPFRDKTFESFDITNPDFREAFEASKKFAKDPLDWLVLRGGPGRGKTHLAAAIANEAEKVGIPVIFAIVPDLLDHLRATFAPSSDMPYDALFDKVREVQLLVLDDFGAENSTAWATEKLFQLINYRYNYRIPTVFTTNDTRLS